MSPELWDVVSVRPALPPVTVKAGEDLFCYSSIERLSVLLRFEVLPTARDADLITYPMLVSIRSESQSIRLSLSSGPWQEVATPIFDGARRFA